MLSWLLPLIQVVLVLALVSPALATLLLPLVSPEVSQPRTLPALRLPPVWVVPAPTLRLSAQ
jgi:hypothetical protein